MSYGPQTWPKYARSSSAPPISITAAALAMLSLGLPGFCMFLYMIRVLQSMQDTRTAFYLYLVENSVNIVFGVVLVGPLGVRGLALSISVAYTVAAIVAVAVIRRRIGWLGGDTLIRPVKRVIGASSVMAVVTVLAVNVSDSTHGIGLLARVVLAVVAGALAYLATAGAAGARAARRADGRAMSLSGARIHNGAYPQATEPADDDQPASAPSPSFRGRLDGVDPDTMIRHLRRVEREPNDDDEEDFHRSEEHTSEL